MRDTALHLVAQMSTRRIRYVHKNIRETRSDSTVIRWPSSDKNGRRREVHHVGMQATPVNATMRYREGNN